MHSEHYEDVLQRFALFREHRLLCATLTGYTNGMWIVPSTVTPIVDVNPNDTLEYICANLYFPEAFERKRILANHARNVPYLQWHPPSRNTRSKK